MALIRRMVKKTVTFALTQERINKLPKDHAPSYGQNLSMKSTKEPRLILSIEDRGKSVIVEN